MVICIPFLYPQATRTLQYFSGQTIALCRRQKKAGSKEKSEVSAECQDLQLCCQSKRRQCSETRGSGSASTGLRTLDRVLRPTVAGNPCLQCLLPASNTPKHPHAVATLPKYVSGCRGYFRVVGSYIKKNYAIDVNNLSISSKNGAVSTL